MLCYIAVPQMLLVSFICYDFVSTKGTVNYTNNPTVIIVAPKM